MKVFSHQAHYKEELFERIHTSCSGPRGYPNLPSDATGRSAYILWVNSGGNLQAQAHLLCTMVMTTAHQELCTFWKEQKIVDLSSEILL